MTDLPDHEIFAQFPNVMIDRDNIAHYRGLLEKRLLINRCDACGYWVYPHRPMCPECLSWQLTPTAISGHGHIFMFTLIHQLRDPDSIVMEPVCAAAVELVERPGLRYLSRIVGCPLDRVGLDMPVALTWIEERGHPMPAFAPAGI